MLNSERGVRVFVGRSFFGQKCPFLRPENGEEKVLPDLGFFRSSIFCYGAFLQRVLGSELRDLYWICFRGIRVCVFCMVLLI